MARLLRNIGADEGTFAARRLTEKFVKQADLVLALTRAQRSLIVDLWPPAVRRTFTLREFARHVQQVDRSRLPDGAPSVRLRTLIPLVMANRGLGRASAKDDDVVDPFRRGDEAYAAAFAEITSAVTVIVAMLVPDRT
jgi:protein-tyrosine phosphatase